MSMQEIIDFHSHILPGIDDGSPCVKESLAMLRMEMEQGVPQVVMTPHFYAMEDDPERFLQRRTEAQEILMRELKNQAGYPKLHMGAEVSFFRGMSESEFLPLLTMDGGKSILIEMPPPPWPVTYDLELERIWQMWGIIPIIAHIDRYIRPFRTYQLPERLADLHVLVQANGSFFLRPATAGMAMRMLKREQIHLLGSDCHNSQTRKPNLGRAIARIQKKLGDGALLRICEFQRQALELEDSAQIPCMR